MAPKAAGKPAKTVNLGEKVPVPEKIEFESNQFVDTLISTGHDGSVTAAVGALKELALGDSQSCIQSVSAVQPIIDLLK